MTQIIYGCWFPSSSYKNTGSCSLKWPKEGCKTLASETTLFLATFSPSSCEWLLIRWRLRWPCVPGGVAVCNQEWEGVSFLGLSSPLPTVQLICCHSLLRYNELSEDEEHVWVTSSQHTPNTQEIFRSSQMIGYKDERSLSLCQNCCVSLRGCCFYKHFQGCMSCYCEAGPSWKIKTPKGCVHFILFTEIVNSYLVLTISRNRFTILNPPS